MTIDKENPPDWLLSLSNTVQTLVRFPLQMEYFRQRVRECIEEQDAWEQERTNYYELEIVKDPRLRDTEAGRPSNDHVWGRYSVSPGELIEGWTPQHLVDNDEFPYKKTLLPLPLGRALNLSEQFTILAAIHDFLLRGGEPIDPWREEARAWWDSPPPHVTGESFLPPGSTYYQLRADVRQLQERDRPVLETFVENVKRDVERSTTVSHSSDLHDETLKPRVQDLHKRKEGLHACAPALETVNDHGPSKAKGPHHRPKRDVPKDVELKGRAAKIVEALNAQITDDTGRSLRAILKDEGVSRETFGNSAHFQEARLAWGTLDSGRDLTRSVRKSDRKSDRRKNRKPLA